jgi:hypothetical protein
MAATRPFDLNVITIASAVSDIAPSDLATAIVQAVAAASRECVAVVEAVLQQEQAATATAAATTLGATIAPADLVTVFQARIATAEAEAQLPRPPSSSSLPMSSESLHLHLVLLPLQHQRH